MRPRASIRRRGVLVAVGASIVVAVVILALLWAIMPANHVERFPVQTNCASVMKSFPTAVTITWVVPDQIPRGSGAWYANTSWDGGKEFDVHAVSQVPGASYGMLTGVTSPAEFSACPIQGAPNVTLTVQATYWATPI